MSLLLLWDIDGTLLLGAADLHRDALHHAIREVYGVEVAGIKIQPAGRTDLEIARTLLVAAEVDDRRIETGFSDLRRSASEYYATHAATTSRPPSRRGSSRRWSGCTRTRT